MASYRDVTPCLKNCEVVDFTVFLYFAKKNVMKKCLVILVVLFSCLCYAQVNAQQMVSTSPTFILNVDDYKPGIYYLRIAGMDEVIVKKIIKK